MLKGRSQSITPLPAFRQPIEQIFLMIVGILQVGIQTVDIVSANTEQSPFIPGIQTGDRLELHIIIHRKKRQTDDTEQHLQITSPGRNNKSSLWSQRTVQRQAVIGSTESNPRLHPVGISLDLSKFEHRTHHITIRSREGTGKEIYLFDKIDIHNTDYPTGSPLSSEMI